MKKEIRKVTVILIAMSILLPVLFSCGKRSTNFSSEMDMLKYLEGTWECVEDKTYIAMRYEEKQEDEVILSTVEIDGYSYPAKANWENVFSNASLSLIHYSDLIDNNYYSIDNIVMCLSGLDYNKKIIAMLSFSNTEDRVNLEEKTVDSIFKKYAEDIGATIRITDEGNIEITGGKNVEIAGTYTFVSSDPDWFYKKTANLWEKAAKKEIDSRREMFNSLKKYYIDETAEHEITSENTKTAIEWIIEGYPYFYKSALSTYETEDTTVNKFYLALGYLSHFDKGSVGANLAENGWNAIEQRVFYKDLDKSQEYLDTFKNTFESKFGISLKTE